jgi:hypothetical protein
MNSLTPFASKMKRRISLGVRFIWTCPCRQFTQGVAQKCKVTSPLALTSSKERMDCSATARAGCAVQGCGPVRILRVYVGGHGHEEVNDARATLLEKHKNETRCTTRSRSAHIR